MYSLVMMMAVSTAGDASTFHWRSAGCHGCYGPRVGQFVHTSPTTYTLGCYGSACYSVANWGCGGCNGCLGSRVVSQGCWSSGYSYPSASCFGSCLGSCHGSCFGSGGCWGSSFGGPNIVLPSVEFSPAVSGTIIHGECHAIPTHDSPTALVQSSPKPASISVELPTGSKLYVDGQLVTGSEKTRSFTTPELSSGQKFFYDMRAEVTLGGEVVKEEIRIVVHAGDKVEKSFGQLLTAVKRHEQTELAKK
jgi:uncharacterized protein (TIGR03000 family)